MQVSLLSHAQVGWTRQASANEPSASPEAAPPTDVVETSAPPQAPPEPNREAMWGEVKGLARKAVPWAIGGGVLLGAVGAAAGSFGGPAGAVLGWVAGKTLAGVLTIGTAAAAGAYTYNKIGNQSDQLFYTCVSALGGLVGGALLSFLAVPFLSAVAGSQGGAVGMAAGAVAAAPFGVGIGARMGVNRQLKNHADQYPELTRAVKEAERKEAEKKLSAETWDRSET